MVDKGREPGCVDDLWNTTERLRALEDAVPAGIVALDLSGRVTIWNRAAEELFGWRASEVIGRPSPLIPDDRRAEDLALAACVLTGEVLSGMETWHLRKDGSQVAISVSCGPIRNAEGEVCGTMRVLTNMTDAKRLERQFLQAQKMEAVGLLAGGIAHDFNNLLSLIVGFSALVLERVRDRPEITTDVEEIKRAGERAARLIQQLLSFSRKQMCVFQVVDLNHVVGHLEKMLSRVVRENIRLEIVAAPSLGHTKADPGQVEQLVMNLVVNARDAMPHGGALTIATADVVVDAASALAHRGAAAGRYVSLTVRDTGSGMTPEVLANVFEPFFTTKGPGKGTGLGLSTVFGLVEQSGGYITVDSTVGVGTIVTTYWPTVDEPVDSPWTETPAPTVEGTETILLVEDETGVRRLMGKVLERYGYTILPARDAEDAMAIEERYAGQIHLMVSDMIMPGLSGPDLAQRIVPRRPSMQVLFVSGYVSLESIDLSTRNHGAGFLQKPFTPETLATMVRERLDRRGTADRAAVADPPGVDVNKDSERPA